MNIGVGIWIGVLSSVVSVSVSYALFEHRLGKLEAAAEEVHPIVFLDPAEMAIEMLPMGSDDADIELFNQGISTLVKAYVDNGFIVLSKGNVIGLPAGAEVSKDELPKPVVVPSQGE